MACTTFRSPVVAVRLRAETRAQATLPPTNVNDRKPVEPLAPAFGLY
jgi:hypothetical protein